MNSENISSSLKVSTTICKWKEGVQFKCFQFWNCILCVILDAAAEREHFFVPCCLSTTKLIKQVRLVTFEFFDRWSFGSSDIHSSQRLYSSLQQIFKLSEFSWKVPELVAGQACSCWHTHNQWSDPGFQTCSMNATKFFAIWRLVILLTISVVRYHPHRSIDRRAHHKWLVLMKLPHW